MLRNKMTKNGMKLGIASAGILIGQALLPSIPVVSFFLSSILSPIAIGLGIAGVDCYFLGKRLPKETNDSTHQKGSKLKKTATQSTASIKERVGNPLKKQKQPQIMPSLNVSGIKTFFTSRLNNVIAAVKKITPSTFKP